MKTGVYYNDHDPEVCEWLRELMKADLIPAGEVDERSILDVEPSDLSGFVSCHFFAGIGGWPQALRLAGWPDHRPVWTGSPPCQPFSVAGQRRGQDDIRHLAPHFLKLVRSCRPDMLFGEQVASPEVFGKVAGSPRKRVAGPPAWAWLDALCDGLEAAHYATGAVDFPSASVGAPHIRQRCFFGAVRMVDSIGPGLEGQPGDGHRSGRPLAPRSTSEASATGGMGHDNRNLPGWGSAEAPRSEGEGRRVEEPGDHRPVDAGSNGGTYPTDGFWREVDWLFCRDGKFRPVEPLDVRMANGVSFVLDTGLHEIEVNAETRFRLAAEALRAVRQGDDPSAIWCEVGGRFGFPAATILLAIVCQHARELGIILDSEAQGSTQDRVATVLRKMRETARENARSPQRREFSEQLGNEFAGSLPKLSQKRASVWKPLALFTPGPLAAGVLNRTALLRGYGNAINPHQAAIFIKAFDESVRAI